jgi:hypothetical protein
MSSRIAKHYGQAILAVALVAPFSIVARANDQDGIVRVMWTIYTDFGWIAKRHRIIDRQAQFKMATEVIGSITSSVATGK